MWLETKLFKFKNKQSIVIDVKHLHKPWWQLNLLKAAFVATIPYLNIIDVKLVLSSPLSTILELSYHRSIFFNRFYKFKKKVLLNVVNVKSSAVSY